MFNIRAVVLDYYMAKEIDELCEKNQYYVKNFGLEPVLRIFGPTPNGEKSCVHIHGVYPYIYVPYIGGSNPERDALLLGAALDKALKTGGNQKSFKFVYKVTLVSGIPIYGYHSKHRQFFKIFFYNPSMVRKASDLLLSGAILGQKLQPHEAHIPYILQFMMDYNIYGMSFVNFKKIKYRRNLENPDSLVGVNGEDIFSAKVQKLTCSYFEVDAHARDIINKNSRKDGIGNPGLEAIWEDERQQRRAQNRISQITLRRSPTRPESEAKSISEVMYKERLAKKLQEVSVQESVIRVSADEPTHSYPAEVPENLDILEASQLDEGSHDPKVEVVPDLKRLIDEKILTQVTENKKGAESEDEEEWAEADSVLGRNQKQEEEVELEDEDGEDMTQPLDFDDNFECWSDAERDEPGKNSTEKERKFWKEMADKVGQLDGAQDSSSESDPDGTLTGTPGSYNSEKNSGRKVSHSGQESGLETESPWSNNIMSILSEESGCPTPSTPCQTPETFWSSYSSKMDSWLNHNHEPWNWNKNETNFSECFSWKNQTGSVSGFSVPIASDPSTAINSSELYVNLFGSDDMEYLPGNCTPVSTTSPLSNIGSISTVSPPSAVLTPASEVDGYPDINLDSICEPLKSSTSSDLGEALPSNESGKVDVPRNQQSQKTIETNKKLMNVLKSFATPDRKVENHQDKTVQLTLKQYIKDCEEIVNVDFKNLCNREMVIIEYKPLNRKSSQNKYLIKPLDKFLQQWNVAERKLNNKLNNKIYEKSGDWPKIINGFGHSCNIFGPVEDKDLSSSLKHKYAGDWLESSKIKSIQNKFSVKSVEMLTDNREFLNIHDNKSYKVNENVISRGKIKMKLIKSQMRNSEKESSRKRGNLVLNFKPLVSDKKGKLGFGSKSFVDSKVRKLTERIEEDVKRYNKISNVKNEGTQINLTESVKRRRDKNKNKHFPLDKLAKKWEKSYEGKNLSELDTKLINQINSSFEEYFKSIMKLNTGHGRNENLSSEDEEERESSDDERSDRNSKGTQKSSKLVDSQSRENFFTAPTLDPVEFASQFLSSFSRMSHSLEMSPISITISLGNTSNSTAVPIQLNFQPTVSKPTKGVKNSYKRHSGQVKIENLDGAVDSSSDEDSPDRDSKSRTLSQKKLKRDTFYKPLKVIVGSPAPERKKIQKRRKKNERKDEHINSSASDIGDCFGVFRESSNTSSTYVEKSNSSCNSKKAIENLKRYNEKSGKKKIKARDDPIVNLEGESDVIHDSGEVSRSEILTGTCMSRSCKTSISQAEDWEMRHFPSNVPESCEEVNKHSTRDQELSDKGITSFYDSSSLGLTLCHDSTIVLNRTDQNSSVEMPDQFFLKDDVPLIDSKEVKSQDLNTAKLMGPDSLSLSSECKNLLKNVDETFPLSKTMPIIPTSGSTSMSSQRNSPDSDLASLPLITSSSNSQEIRKPSSQHVKSDFQVMNPSRSGPFMCASQDVKSLSGHDLEVGRASSREDSQSEAVTSFVKVSVASQKSSFNSSQFLDGFNLCGFGEITMVLGSKIITPKQKPPSKKNIYAYITQMGIQGSLAQAPFYGNPHDVTKAMEMGPRILKIESNSIAGLKPYKSTLEIIDIETRRSQLLEPLEKGGCKMRYFLASQKDITIRPLRKPPSSKTVAKWLENKNKFKNNKSNDKTKIKLVRPLSPGQESESEEEMDLSVSLSESYGFSGENKEGNKTSSDFAGAFSAKPLGSTGEAILGKTLELELKKGPLSKIKGIKRLSLMNKLEAISEETSKIIEPTSHSSSDSQPVSDKRKSLENSYQIRGVSCDNTLGFSGCVENLKTAKLSHSYQYMTLLVLEVHVQTRKDFRPDPQYDPIRAVFYAIEFDSPIRDRETGIIVVGKGMLTGTGVSESGVHYVSTETDLIEKLLELIQNWDPDILAGYEIEMNSWGYLVQRGFVLEMNLFTMLGRVRNETFPSKETSDLAGAPDEFDDIPKSVRHMKISGRIVLDIWRVLRHEVALTSYTFENVMYHLVHERHPLLSYETLSLYWDHSSRRFRHLTVEYYMTRVSGIIRLLDQLDFINRTSELSRLFGIQFYEVLSRGSQYRVESMMLRLAKPLNFIPVSPSVSQRANMRAPGCLPLILEPESMFYSDPVIVLDFQSLYPSMIIAYNYCFSTCLGQVEKLGKREPFEFGCTQLQISPEEVKSLEDNITISPAGVAFVKSNIRKGILPAMLEEILETRLMVKKSMKENKENKTLQKLLFARQLGLKLIANVTYGYTAANFSGRMPCIEVGDSVVSKGRETLERAIKLIKSTSKWGAKVVYGDTDSVFVLTPGRTRGEAFQIGAEIAEAVTQDNPKPVKLKLEKVYQPSILQTKKRYVGYMYESPDQEKPVFEAKGIETVRRDGCPATGKILQKALQILFDTKDVSLVKKYTIRQFTKIFQGRVNKQDFIFAKEYRGRRGYRPGACVPALELAKRWTEYDKRAEPRVKERVPYVIVNGAPGVPLIKLVRSLAEIISSTQFRINAVYYITKAILPPMQRCFSLLGVDVMAWYSEIPRKCYRIYKSNPGEVQKKVTISQYFSTVECIVCYEITSQVLCSECEKLPQMVAVCLSEKARRLERCHSSLLKICQSCCQRPTELDCESFDCPVFFRRNQALRDMDECSTIREILQQCQ